LLQWGHDFSAVEIWRCFCGDDVRLGFNGATTFQPWKWRKNFQDTDGIIAWLQWGHDFSAVEITTI